MTVKTILTSKGRDVATASPDLTMQDLARTLADRRIGAMIVTGGGGEVIGIVSERDVVRALARGGAASLAEPVASHMTREVVTCREDHTIVHVMEQMTRGRFRHMPVTQDGKLVGVVSIGDIVKHRVAEMENEQKALKEYIASA